MKNLIRSLFLIIALGVLAPSSNLHAQSVRDFAATNLDFAGGFVRRLANNSELGMFRGKLNIQANGNITGSLEERNFASGNSTSTSVPLNVLPTSKVFATGIKTTTSSYTSVTTNHFYSNADRRTHTSISTNTATVVTHHSDFVINIANGYLAKGRVACERETYVMRNTDGVSSNYSRFVFLDGAVYKRSGELVGPFNAGTRLSQ